ncbi:hypothetical protein OHR68_41985 [Spirillospora sp. NBC_00431]
MADEGRSARPQPPITGRPAGVGVTSETRHDKPLEEGRDDSDYDQGGHGRPGVSPYGQRSSTGRTVEATASTEDTAGTGNSGNLAAASATGGPEDLPPLFESPRIRELQQRWHEIQAAFVDDPRDAVRQAGALNDEIVNSLTTALDDRRRGLQSGIENGDTEQLRIAMRRYRRMLDQILTL